MLEFETVDWLEVTESIDKMPDFDGTWEIQIEGEDATTAEMKAYRMHEYKKVRLATFNKDPADGETYLHSADWSWGTLTLKMIINRQPCYLTLRRHHNGAEGNAECSNTTKKVVAKRLNLDTGIVTRPAAVGFSISGNSDPGLYSLTFNVGLGTRATQVTHAHSSEYFYEINFFKKVEDFYAVNTSTYFSSRKKTLNYLCSALDKVSGELRFYNTQGCVGALHGYQLTEETTVLNGSGGHHFEYMRDGRPQQVTFIANDQWIESLFQAWADTCGR